MAGAGGHSPVVFGACEEHGGSGGGTRRGGGGTGGGSAALPSPGASPPLPVGPPTLRMRSPAPSAPLPSFAFPLGRTAGRLANGRKGRTGSAERGGEERWRAGIGGSAGGGGANGRGRGLREGAGPEGTAGGTGLPGYRATGDRVPGQSHQDAPRSSGAVPAPGSRCGTDSHATGPDGD